MHFASHVQAYYAHWMRRYLHPNSAPWKDIADIWLADPYPMQRGMILTDISGSFATDPPRTAPYLRACVAAFQDLNLQQDTNILDPAVNAESIFFNNRFEVDVASDAAEKWSKYLGLKRIYNIIDPDSETLFTESDMKEFAYEHAPDGIAGTRSVHEFVDTVMQTWSVVRDSIPQSILRQYCQVLQQV